MSSHGRFRNVRTALSPALACAAAAAVLLPLTAGQAHAAGAFAAWCPATGRITQGYHSGHDGVDIGNSMGSAIRAAGAGRVISSGPARGYGQWIRIRHTDGTVTEYGHMYRRLVSVGDRVPGGRRIALMGSEGNSTGPHLHFEAHADSSFSRGLDPAAYLSVRGVALPCTARSGHRRGGVAVTTWGHGVRVRAEAGLHGRVLRTLAGPTRVRVTCQRHGGTVRAEGVTSDGWSYVPALGGYVSTIYINQSGSPLTGVPEC